MVATNSFTRQQAPCGRLVDVEDGAVPALRLPESRGSGFRITDYSVSFLGLCGACARAKRR